MGGNILHAIPYPDSCEDILKLVDECDKPRIVNVDGLRVDLSHDARHSGRFQGIRSLWDKEDG